MISLVSYSEDFRRFDYRNLSSEAIDLTMEIRDGYTGALIYKYEISEMQPGVDYWTWHPAPFRGRTVLMKHRPSGNVLAMYKIPGSFDVKSIDTEDYIKNLIPRLDEEQQKSVMDVIREHFIFREYKDFCDVEYGDFVIDIGFNYGIFSLAALQKGASKVIGFEPSRSVVRSLIDIYPTSKLTLEQKAVSDKNLTLMFYEGKGSLGSNILRPEAGSEFKESYEVQCINFHEYLAVNDIKRIDLLKVDCEGTEYEIFQCIPDEIFSNIRKIHVEFHDNDGVRVDSIIDKLERNGFEWRFEAGKDRNSDLGMIFARKQKEDENN